MKKLLLVGVVAWIWIGTNTQAQGRTNNWKCDPIKPQQLLAKKRRVRAENENSVIILNRTARARLAAFVANAIGDYGHIHVQLCRYPGKRRAEAAVIRLYLNHLDPVQIEALDEALVRISQLQSKQNKSSQREVRELNILIEDIVGKRDINERVKVLRF